MFSIMSTSQQGPGLTLLRAPHRLFFFAGAAQLVVTLAFWLYALIGLYLPGVPATTLTIVGSAAHVFLMLYGLFTFFVFGFLTTVFPRWLNTAPIERRRYTAIVTILSAGILCYYGGLFTTRPLAVAGTIVFVVGWAWGLLTLLQTWRRSGHANKYFALYPFGCVTAGWIGACIYAAWLITRDRELLDIAIEMGFWLYLVPLIVAVSYRMIPFFSGNVLSGYKLVKPGWTLPATLACMFAHFALTIAGRPEWTITCDLPLALLAAWHTWRWELFRALRIPLLGMLHVSFAWLAVAMGLYAAQSALRLAGAPFDLGLAPLHALGIGFVTGMVVAMASRVSLGHSGRPLIADRATLWTFAVVQVVAVVRVVAEVPPFHYRMAGIWLVLAAAVIWLAAFIPWSLRFGTVYLRPRVDGKPG